MQQLVKDLKYETVETFLIFYRYRIMYHRTESDVRVDDMRLDFSYINNALDDLEKNNYFFDEYLKNQVTQIRDLMSEMLHKVGW